MYQWLAVGLFVAGIFVTACATPAVQSAGWLGSEGVALALLAGLLAAFLMSVDFPDSQRRFSRLTVRNPV